MSQFERAFPPNLENESRRQKYPQTCSAQCPHRTCGYHTLENYGKPCQMQWKPHKNENMQPNSKSNINETLLRNLEIGIVEVIEKAMKPFEKRLQAMENAKPSINRSFNGTSPKHYRESLTLGTIYD